MSASAAVGRPKIEGLVSFNLRILADQRDALVAICETERAARHDPGLTITDLIREYITKGIAEHDRKTKRLK